MPRLSKTDVNAAFDLAAKAIIDAGGKDGRISRSDVVKALPTLPGPQRALVDVFFRFIDARDAAQGAQVTGADVAKAVAYAKEKLVARYDLNNNGLSKDEIARMSLTGKRAVDLAKALKAAPPAVPLEPLAPPRDDEGLSEPDEILAAGQVPRDWVPAVALDRGALRHDGTNLVGFDTTVALTPEQREVAGAAFEFLWEHTFQHRVDGAAPLELGPTRQGTLKLGEFTRSDDGKQYLVADWRDIDDASFTLYYQRVPDGRLRLAISQFNN